MLLSMVFVVASNTLTVSQSFESYSWSALPSLPTPLGYIIGGVYGNEIHVLGGYDGNGLQKNEYSTTIQYDRSTNTIMFSNWGVTSISSTFPTIPELGSDTQQYVNIDEFIYIMGTDDRIWLEDAPGKLIIYNMKTQSFKDTTTYSSTMNVARSGNCITTDGIYLYSIGGHDSIGYATTDFIKYHIENDEWSNGVPINTARYSAQCVLVVDNLYVIGGGSHNGVAVLNMEVFNLNDESKQWIVVNIPEAILSSFAYNVNSNGIYLAGGATSVSYGNAVSAAYFYNISHNLWSTKDSMLTGVYAFASIIYQPDTEWMFIIHIGGVVSCGTFCLSPVYSHVSQYTRIKIINTSSNETTLSPSGSFTTTNAHSNETTHTTELSLNSTQTSIVNVSATVEDLKSANPGESKNIITSEGMLSIVKKPLVYLSLIVLVLVIITVSICICCRCCKKSNTKAGSKASDDKTIPLTNPMVILVGIGEYDKQPKHSDLLDGTFIDLPIDIDIKNLLSLFKDELRYEIYPQYLESIKTHWTEHELIEWLKKQAQLLENNLIHNCDDNYNDNYNDDRFDGLILVLSSHGIQDHIITSDHRKIEKLVIHRIFSIGHPESRNIPRIVLFDCCDGNEFSKGSQKRKHADSVIGKQYGIQQLESSSHKPSWQRGDKNPDYKLATIHAANVGFQSNMSKTKGSFVIHKFVEKTKASLIQYGEGQMLSELFDEIQQELGDTKQLPVFMWNNGTGNVKFMTKDRNNKQTHNVKMKKLIKRNPNSINYKLVSSQ